VTDPNTGEQWIIQVGKQTKAGNPISRETKAIKDLESAGWKVEFVPYN
jgi:G:T-mismatch repair DNA endonuclease (very short patch repair protein)